MTDQPDYYFANDADNEPTMWRPNRWSPDGPPIAVMRRCVSPEAFDLLAEHLDADQCTDCGTYHHPRDLSPCAGGPIGRPPPKHCSDCLPDCGPCRDEMARENRAERLHQ